MDRKKLQLYFLLSVLAATSALVFFIFLPFAYPLILAMVFASIFRPVHKKLSGFVPNKPGLAAFFTVLLVIIFILTPFVFLGMQIYQEVKQFYFSFFENGGMNAISILADNLMDKVRGLFPVPQDFSLDINGRIGQNYNLLLQNIGSVFSNLAHLIFNSFIFLIALYYLLKDGEKLKKAILALSPLADKDDEMIFKKLEAAVNSIVRGSLLIAIIQGALTAIGFFVFGIPNPVLWGSVAAIAALIPGVGTALVITPAIIFLFITGKTFAALGLLLWGALAVGLIDNFLGPKLIGGKMQLHPLLILFAVIGGIGFFGPVGFLLGPLTLSLFFALLEIYLLLTKRGSRKTVPLA